MCVQTYAPLVAVTLPVSVVTMTVSFEPAGSE